MYTFGSVNGLKGFVQLIKFNLSLKLNMMKCLLQAFIFVLDKSALVYKKNERKSFNIINLLVSLQNYSLKKS